MKIFIGGKEYEIRMTMGDLEKIGKKYNLTGEGMKKLSPEQYQNFAFKAAHRFLIRRRGLKPFITPGAMKRRTTFKEYIAMCNAIAKMLNGEDEESGNA